jgi:hypothetical protein
MILITYEFRTHHYKTLQLDGHVCPLCKDTHDLKLHINHKYLWTFFLLGPVAPREKFGILACSACKTNIPPKSWSPEIKALFKSEKKLVKPPLRLWRGLVILICMLVGVFVYGAKAVRKNKMFANVEKYAQDVEKDDILIVSDSTDVYGINQNKIMKIQKIEGNNVFLVLYADRVAWEEQSEVEKEDLDPEKFGKEVLIVSLSYLKRRQDLMKFDKNGREEFLPCAGINGIIK